jgi:hypothetical protein
MSGYYILFAAMQYILSDSIKDLGFKIEGASEERKSKSASVSA